MGGFRKGFRKQHPHPSPYLVRKFCLRMSKITHLRGNIPPPPRQRNLIVDPLIENKNN
jgi:hypothetical protein